MNRARKHQAGKILIIFVLTVIMVLGAATAAYAVTTRDTDVTSAGSGNTIVYHSGEFLYVSKDTILKRINDIRYEAWSEGLVSAYIPIQWSSDLEWIAQTRAAEATVYASHTRPTYKSYSTCSHNGNHSVVEVLYWSGSASMMDAIETWYSEKGSASITHYIELINPSNRYIGLGGFIPGDGGFGAVAGEFSESTSMKTAQDGTYGSCKQAIEVDSSALSGSSISMASSVYKGKTTKASLNTETYYSGVFTFSHSVSLPKVTWSSSDTSIATVDSSGVVTGVKLGKATITAKSGGVTCSKTITVKAKNGWFKEGGYYYYYKSGKKLKDQWIDDGKGWAYVDENGRMLKSQWIQKDGKWYYLLDNGYMAKNQWVYDGKGYCYVNSKGVMLKNRWIRDGNDWYYVKDNGYMAKSQWVNDGKGYCYVNAKGKMLSSRWLKVKDNWYYLKASGYRATSEWIDDGTGRCYFNSKGVMLSSRWLTYSNNRYYLGSDGYMVKNAWAKEKGKWRWLGSDGKAAKSKWIQYNGDWYYLNSSGYMVTGWKKIGGVYYYFHPTNGNMYAGGTYTIGGKKYTFASSGALKGNPPSDVG
ncbi:MAG: Ig-like domain-containing protein [Firmicutes bacterium]|nr:Ig-like domain-containing protein [Bacillota bacterium]